MSTITTIQSSDLITNSRTDINTNFSNLNTDKIETSTLDTDTALAANSDSKIATQKAVKGYIDAQTLTGLTIETTTGVTHSLTTTAGQKVIVWAKGDYSGSASSDSVVLKYNGVTKDTVAIDGIDASNESNAFALMYTETPGAGTHNVTVTSGYGLGNVVIIVLKY